MVLLLLNHCLFTSHCLWGSVFGLCFGMHYFVAFLVLQSCDEEEKANCFAIIVSLMSCDCYCSVSLPHAAVGWSAVCDCDIS